jgi:Mg2+-importing ATPase
MSKKAFDFRDYTIKSFSETLQELNSSLKGLTEEEATKRLAIFGFNEIPSKKIQWFEILLRQFKSPFCYLLLIAGLIALLIGEEIDSAFILLFVFINVVLGFIQEFRAEKAIQYLKKFLDSRVKVIREGEEKIIEKKYLVPGDIVVLKAGDIAPAELRVIEVKNLTVDESVLTGESKTVSKIVEPLKEKTKEIFEAKNIIFAGTSIVSGEVKGVVIFNIKDSSIGRIAKLVEGVGRESAYAKELLDFSKLILKIVIVSIATIFVLKLITHRENILDFLIFCIALIVSILPEALPTVVVFSLSQGAMRLAKKKVVVKRLSAIEDLGNIKILCSDKTGTLTENKLAVDSIYSADPEKTLLFGLLSSDFLKPAIKNIDNAFDISIYQKANEKIKNQLKNYQLVFDNPFDLKKLFNSALVKNEANKKLLIIKGAPEKILEKSISFEGGFSKEAVEEKIKLEGKSGKRVLAIAYKETNKETIDESDEKDFKFLGLISFVDPLKKTAKGAIRLAEKLGVRVKLITGDSREVAGYVGYQIGLIKNPEEVITGKELEALEQKDFEQKCEEIDVFARIAPEMKYKIVETLQKKYEVGFLGEGINDAPALKVANVAIAVNTAADISREVADIILLENDLNVIVEGISQGRKIFANLNKYIKTTLTSTFGNFYSIATISLFISFLPLLPLQILLVNLLSDFPMIAIATDQVEIEELKRPKMYEMKKMISLIIRLALVSSIFDFIFFAIFYKTGEKNIQTLWFIESILTELILIFSLRTNKPFLKTIRPSYPLLTLAALASLVTIILPFTNFGISVLHFQTPALKSIVLVLGLVIAYFFVSEFVKLKYCQLASNKNQHKLNS